MVRDELDEKRAKLAAVGDVDELQMRLDNASKQRMSDSALNANGAAYS